MEKKSDYTVRAYEPGDEEALLALHNRAFDGAAPRSMEHWRWRFLENPLREPEITLAINADGHCAAVYAAISHHALINGKPRLAGLQTDAAIAADRRVGLGGGRHFVAVGKLFRERFVTPRTGVEWGFPEPPLQRVCMRHLQVGVLRDVTFVLHEAARDLRFPRPDIEVRKVERFDGDLDELWNHCKEQFPVATIRDAAYLNWRYATHPDIDYTLLEARDPQTGRLRGVNVLRSGGWDAQLLSIMDQLCPEGDTDAEAALLHRAADVARERDAAYIAAWMPWPPMFHRYQADFGFFARVTPFQESYRTWTKGADRRWLAMNWYQTMGDIDFF